MQRRFKSAREYAEHVLAGGEIMWAYDDGTTGSAYPPSWVTSWSNYAWYEAPNPHVEGSFLWAKHEADRGHTVSADSVCGGTTPFRAAAFGPGVKWLIEFIVATDWRIVE